MSFDVVTVPEDHIVCRLCLELVKNDSAIPLGTSTDIVLKLEQYFPELDLTCTEDTVICDSCQVSLQHYFNFISNCLKTEEKILEYCKVEGTNIMGQIDLNSVTHFISKGFLKSTFELATVKIEGTYNEVSENVSYCVETKKEEISDMELDIKDNTSAQASESELIDENSSIMEKDKRKGGHVCSYGGCKNKSYDRNGGKKFYRFPKEAERAKYWLAACNRPDLLDKVNTLHKSYTICDTHFHPRMFKKGQRQLLRQDAVPVSFFLTTDMDKTVPTTSGLRSISSSATNSTTQIAHAPGILRQLLEPASKKRSSPDKTESIEKSPICPPTRYVQTPETLTFHTARESKLMQINMAQQLENIALKRENQELRSKCNDLEKKLEKKLEEAITLEQYKTLTYALCPSPDLAEFIIIQMSQSIKSSEGRRYS